MALRTIGLVGGIVLLFFAVLHAQEARTLGGDQTFGKPSKGHYAGRPGVVLGVVFTALNPFFLLWWASVGVQLIELAVAFGAIAGVAIMYLAHIWMDYAWWSRFIASRRRFSLGKWYRTLLVGFAVAMVYFGVIFIISSIF